MSNGWGGGRTVRRKYGRERTDERRMDGGKEYGGEKMEGRKREDGRMKERRWKDGGEKMKGQR